MSETRSSEQTTASPLIGETQLYIDGRWRHASDGSTRDIVNPATGATFMTVDEATPADATAAITAARRAFDHGEWPRTPVAERAALLRRIADLVAANRAELSRLETLDTGKTLAESLIDLTDVESVLRYYASLVEVTADRAVDVGNPAVISRVVREPIGVCVLIAPWNYPLLQMSWKIAPALAAGCTMVAKPSEVTPLSTIAFVLLCEQAGVAPGVLNLLQGAGSSLGPALTDTDDVDFISFTGGLSTGRVISATAAQHITKVAVELGGKNPHIVFADADWESAVDLVLTGVFLHSGQVCSAGTRVIVEESIADDFVDALVTATSQIRIGDGLDPRSATGPLVSQAQLDKMTDYVASALAEGAVLRTGGGAPESADRHPGGYWFSPTIFDHCDRSMRIVREETFGPILTVERFTTEAQALALGNDTDYGLAAGVQTSDAAVAARMTRGLRHGTVWCNDFGYYTPAAEWGGFGKSGNGRELGPTGLAEYQETKHIWHNTAPTAPRWFTSEGTHRDDIKNDDIRNDDTGQHG
ncbi:aldehyde dehydrogenase family protein [Gordonia jinhuaensis]|uniref:Betaine-aldehyde dehydrogenase n=1 Tax=Gordonia jinhuaensis TaxID=1517702 RepID=A0A916T0V9_9ACTN|nr:betaine-aldehyde dehydrogenase [Gordonia jinhuaensis]